MSDQKALEFIHSFVCLFICFRDKVSLCSPGCPGTHSVEQAGLKLKSSACLYLPSAGVKGVPHHCLAKSAGLGAL